jgi:hypothetical protein
VHAWGTEVQGSTVGGGTRRPPLGGGRRLTARCPTGPQLTAGCDPTRTGRPGSLRRKGQGPVRAVSGSGLVRADRVAPWRGAGDLDRHRSDQTTLAPGEAIALVTGTAHGPHPALTDQLPHPVGADLTGELWSAGARARRRLLEQPGLALLELLAGQHPTIVQVRKLQEPLLDRRLGTFLQGAAMLPKRQARIQERPTSRSRPGERRTTREGPATSGDQVNNHWQMMTAPMTPARSALRAANMPWRQRVTPTAPK